MIKKNEENDTEMYVDVEVDEFPLTIEHCGKTVYVRLVDREGKPIEINAYS
jgi:hypothetical protein